MDYLPLFLDLTQKSVLVVGAGEVAERKISLLLRAGAKVTVVAPEVGDGVARLRTDEQLAVLARGFRPGDVEGNALVVAATDDEAINESVFRVCKARNILVNSVDQPQLSSAIFPALVDRSPVLVAVSTGGNSPTLARLVRGWLEARLPARLGGFARFIGGYRRDAGKTIVDAPERQRFWEAVVNGPIAEAYFRGDEAAAHSQLKSLLADNSDSQGGSVTLVGAGPGDPELITLKGLRRLQSADVSLYDNLVNEQLLDFARRDAKTIYVGKKRKFPGVRQEGINELLLEHAQAGRRVVRLKGGDPFIFGRGGEETETLAAAGIPCQVVPGITAASGSASYAGIPLTHRSVSQSVRFVTGHRVYDHVNLDWPELAKPDQTLVIYMGLTWIEEITARLVEHGLPPDTPAALVEKATLPEQRVLTADVANLAQVVRSAGVNGPTTIIVGKVVAYGQGH